MSLTVLDIIQQRRDGLQLQPREEVIQILSIKIDQVASVIPDIIQRIALKLVYDLESCDSEEKLFACIIEWADQTSKQNNPEIQFFMNAMGSVLLRVEV